MTLYLYSYPNHQNVLNLYYAVKQYERFWRFPIKISFKKNELFERVSRIEEIIHIVLPNSKETFVVSIRKNTFKNAKNLRKLETLGHLIEKDTFDQMDLHSLDLGLGQNQLCEIIPTEVNLLEAIAGLKNLELLSLNCESLQRIDQNSFASLARLKLLNLSFNHKIEFAQNTFKNMQSLVVLLICNCSLESIQG
jgi:hypothetical protein